VQLSIRDLFVMNPCDFEAADKTIVPINCHSLSGFAGWTTGNCQVYDGRFCVFVKGDWLAVRSPPISRSSITTNLSQFDHHQSLAFAVATIVAGSAFTRAETDQIGNRSNRKRIQSPSKRLELETKKSAAG
jgi:hypothetical protein